MGPAPLHLFSSYFENFCAFRKPDSVSENYLAHESAVVSYPVPPGLD